MISDERREILLELYKEQLKRFDLRRSYEWKITLGFWTAIIASTAFFIDNKVRLESPTVLGILYLILWLIYTFSWTRGTWRANEKDKFWAFVYRSELEVLLNINVKKYIDETPDTLKFPPSSFGFFVNWSRVFQILTTGILLLLSWLIITGSNVTSENNIESTKEGISSVAFFN